MKINYWDCKYANYDESWDERIYGCLNESCDFYCDINNKWSGEKAECEFAEVDDKKNPHEPE